MADLDTASEPQANAPDFQSDAVLTIRNRRVWEVAYVVVSALFIWGAIAQIIPHTTLVEYDINGQAIQLPVEVTPGVMQITSGILVILASGWILIWAALAIPVREHFRVDAEGVEIRRISNNSKSRSFIAFSEIVDARFRAINLSAQTFFSFSVYDIRIDTRQRPLRFLLFSFFVKEKKAGVQAVISAISSRAQTARDVPPSEA